MDKREERDDFGLDISNPIQVSSIPEERNYLDRIVTDSGEETTYERLGSELSTDIKTVSEGLESVGTMVDYYEISNPKGEHLATFYICPYFERNSSVAPRGFNYRTSSSIQEEPLANIESYIEQLESMSLEEYKAVTIKTAKERGIDIPPDLDFEVMRRDIINNARNPDKKSAQTSEGGGCFIATATMGDYDDPMVLELRKFRDNWILKRTWGKKFVELYYYYGFIASEYIASNLILRKLSFYFIVKPVYFISRILLIKPNS